MPAERYLGNLLKFGKLGKVSKTDLGALRFESEWWKGGVKLSKHA